MRHGVDGRQFGRCTPHRKAMLKALANQLLTKEKIITTVEKAKEARRTVERLITLAKLGTQASQRVAFNRTQNKTVVQRLFGDLATRYKDRQGGYTRILKLSERRRGDGAELAVLELVDSVEVLRGRQGMPKKETVSNETEAAEKLSLTFTRFKRVFAGRKKAKISSSEVSTS